ncbi:MAG TPA: serine protease [Anaerolineales bacterium]|nr:serine protease [Anaerolineales bacterium]
MSTKKGNRKWLTWGIAVVALGCIGIVIAFGGLAAIGALMNNSGATPQANLNSTETHTSIPNTPTTALTPTSAATTTPAIRAIPFESVVQIVAMYYDESNRLVPGWTGSGSIISADGLILTNAHVVMSDRYYHVDALGVAFSDREDRAPQLRYYAEILQVDEALDIAVIKVTTDLNNNVLESAALNLPYIPLGNADDLRLGDQITILGYPGIGGETITLTRGEVSGFTTEVGRGDRAFIKTSATIAGGNSGGLAADAEGYLIGIPTQLGYGGEDQFVDCRVLADTNRDGVVDDRDNCIPTGGFINALRPINLALPLIEAAQDGIVNATPGPAPTVVVDVPQESAVIFEDDFSTITGNWNYSGSAGAITHVQDELQIEITDTDFFLWGLAGGDFDDVIIDVDSRVRVEAGDGDFGLICRYQDNENFYGLEISEDGYYAIWKYSGGEFVPLVDWRFSSQLADIASDAHLTATCAGNTLALSVNGEWLAEVNDNEFTSGDAGLIGGSWTIAPIVIRFDNFVVSRAE